MTRRGWWAAVAVGLTVGWVASTSAHDPDACHKAKEWSDMMVCGNPNLTALDGKVDKAYEDAQRGLSPKDAEEVREVHAAWMRGREKCQQDADPTKCLEDYYQQRIKGIVQPKASE